MRSDLFLCRKTPIPTKRFKLQSDNTKTPPKCSISQRLRTDLGRSVAKTTAIQLVWLNSTQTPKGKIVYQKYLVTSDIGFIPRIWMQNQVQGLKESRITIRLDEDRNPVASFGHGLSYSRQRLVSQTVGLLELVCTIL